MESLMALMEDEPEALQKLVGNLIEGKALIDKIDRGG